MKYIILLIVVILLSLNVKSQNNQQLFIDKYDNMALKLMKKHNIPTSIILSISMLESGYGTSKLSKNKNNFFGVKKGKYYRGYINDTASFNDFCLIISKKKYYKNLIDNGIVDYNIWINKIHHGGYSQSKNWSMKVLYYIRRYKLYELDNLDSNAI